MRISDWSSDVCSSDLEARKRLAVHKIGFGHAVEVSDPQSRHACDVGREIPICMKLTVKQPFYQSIGIPRFSGMFVEPVINVAIMIKMREPTSADGEMNRSEERREGKECDRKCRSGGRA